MRSKAPKKNGKVRVLTPEEGRKIFDRQARRLFKMSGEEFVRRFEAEEFGDPEDPYRPELMDLVMQLPLMK